MKVCDLQEDQKNTVNALDQEKKVLFQQFRMSVEESERHLQDAWRALEEEEDLRTKVEYTLANERETYRKGVVEVQKYALQLAQVLVSDLCLYQCQEQQQHASSGHIGSFLYVLFLTAHVNVLMLSHFHFKVPAHYHLPRFIQTYLSAVTLLP